MFRMNTPIQCGVANFIVAAVLLLAVSGTALAQTDTGAIRGVVYDESGAVISNATVRAVDENRGLQREVSTDDGGEYILSYLDPGTYVLEFVAEDFAHMQVEGFEVLVGQTATFSPQLAVAAAQESIVVDAGAVAPVIEPERTAQSEHLDAMNIQNLPINRRDYLDLALLLPGVVDTNYVVNDSDFRIAPTPQSGLGIGGTNGRGNTFMVDGLDNVYNSGSVRSQIGQDAVQEFQINRNTYSPEQGGSPGGAVNIVTKSGSNDFNGSLFGVIRNRRFQARNYFDPGKSAYTRVQSGVSAGGAVVPNCSFLFGAYERLDRQESSIVPLLSDDSFLRQLTPSQQALADALGTNPMFAPVVGQLVGALTPGNNPAVIDLFNRNSGVFPFREDRQTGLARWDHNVSDGHNLFVRGNWTRQNNENSNFGALTGFTRGRFIDLNDVALAFGSTQVLSPQWVSETRVGLAYHDFNVQPTDPFGPSVTINGFGEFGRDFILPTRVSEKVVQVRHNMVRVTGRQTLKFGADINPLRDSIRAETFLSGRFIFGEAIPLANLIDQQVGPGTSALLKGTLASLGATPLVGAVDAPISSLQAYSLGIPIVYQQGFGDPTWLGWSNRYNFYAEDAIRLSSQFVLTLGLRYELEHKTRFVRDNNNFGPRAGFAWSPDPKTVIRGGFGLFYSRLDGQVTYVNDLLGNEQQISQVFVPVSGFPNLFAPLLTAQIWGGLNAMGVIGTRPVVASDLATFGVPTGPGLPLRVNFSVADDVVNPYSQQGSFEIQRQFGSYAFSAGYNYNRGVHLIRPLDVNIANGGTDENGRPVAAIINPLRWQENVYGSWGRSYYHALILKLNKRFSKGFTISAHHTWSKTIDENTDYNTSFEPHLQWDARNDLALSAYHRGHRFVAHAVAQSPWKASSGRGFGHNLLADFTLSGIVVARSFGPFNLNAGSDTIGDRHTDTHRPFRLGRNVGRGPAFFGLDARLTRSFSLGEGADLQVIAEGFNLFNRTNFRTINGTVGTLQIEDLPSDLVGRRAPVTEPLAFTSAFDPRQFQFTLRLNF